MRRSYVEYYRNTIKAEIPWRPKAGWRCVVAGALVVVSKIASRRPPRRI